MALYLIVVQAHFIMNNIFEGMIWFFPPVSCHHQRHLRLYLRHHLRPNTTHQALPKKTVEGFVGAWILTIVFGFAMTNVLMRYKYFICPVNVK
jgi:phosphatidate cytidylyltransferase